MRLTALRRRGSSSSIDVGVFPLPRQLQATGEAKNLISKAQQRVITALATSFSCIAWPMQLSTYANTASLVAPPRKASLLKREQIEPQEGTQEEAPLGEGKATWHHMYCGQAHRNKMMQAFKRPPW
eukprot:1152735-Pelagomonas_calceolata.AAC.5